jgi:hypothetical protein
MRVGKQGIRTAGESIHGVCKSSEGSYGSADVKTKLRFYRKTLHLEYGRSSDFLSEKIKK